MIWLTKHEDSMTFTNPLHRAACVWYWFTGIRFNILTFSVNICRRLRHSKYFNGLNISGIKLMNSMILISSLVTSILQDILQVKSWSFTSVALPSQHNLKLLKHFRIFRFYFSRWKTFHLVELWFVFCNNPENTLKHFTKKNFNL